MSSQIERAETFKTLHKPGNPVIIYNVWDAGSALAVESVGAKAIATGGHGVANAHGFEDGEEIPIELVLANAKRITDAIELPFSMDIDAGYGESLEDVKATVTSVLDAGVIGINIEDKLLGSMDLRSVEGQSDRIAAIREAANEAGIPLFINARSDIFSTADASTHNEDLLAVALERANAYAAAGADGFFVPKLHEINLIKQLCEQSPLPVNIILLDGAPSPSDLAAAGVARISHGPIPYLTMIEWLKDNAKQALSAV